MSPFFQYYFRFRKSPVFLQVFAEPLQVEKKNQVVFSGTIIEETEIADFLEPFRKHMEYKTPDEFLWADRNFPRLPPVLPSCGETDFLIRNGEDPAVRNCDLIRIPSEIFDRVTFAVKCFLYVGNPFFVVEGITELVPLVGIAELLALSRKREAAGFPCFLKAVEKLSAKKGRKHAFRYEKGVRMKRDEFPPVREPAA